MSSDVVSTFTVKQIVARPKMWQYMLLRWLGGAIDLVFIVLLFLIPDMVLGNARYQETIWFWAIVAIIYFPVLEGIWGRSIGKLIAGTMVVGESGKAPGIWKAILRTITRFFEVNPVAAGCLPAAIAVAMSQNRQRLGDMLAGTYVVRVKDLALMAGK
jgi:uncharacterized RDD family membrane protein YckC